MAMASGPSTESTESAPAAQTPSGETGESPLHERSGIELRTLIRFVVIFIVAAIAIHLIVWLVFVVFRSAAGQPREITGVTEARIAPPEPRLQPSVQHNALPALDLATMREAERAELARRGFVDEKSGQIRVPDEIVARVARMSQPRK